MNAPFPPGFAAFRAAYDDGRGTLVWSRGVADLETPVAAFLKLAHGRPNSFLLESVEGGAARGRYSIIGMEPDLIWAAGRRSTGTPARRRTPFPPTSVRHSTACARWSPRQGSTCRTRCRRCRAGWSAISATTWCG